jgi:Domain of unknown function (DUF4397)
MSQRKASLAVGVAVLIASLTTCKLATANKSTALVRFVHAVSNAGPLDFYADTVRDVNGLEFQNATSYFVVDSGQAIPFSVNIINQTTPIVTTTETVAAAHTYTFMAADSMAGLTPLFIADSNTAPSSTDVKLRVIHGAPSFKTVDIYFINQGDTLPSTPALGSFQFEQVSQYQLKKPGSYYMVATAPGDPTTIATVDTLSSLGNGTVRTIILMDRKKGGLPLASITVNDVTR